MAKKSNVLELQRDQVVRWLPNAIIAALVILAAVLGTYWPLWIDEIFTLRVADLGSPLRIVGVLLKGVDGSPPLYALAASVTMRLFPFDMEMGIRLPSLIAYALFLVGILRISKGLFSGATPMFCVMTAGILRLDTGYTARPYAFVLCFSVWMIAHLLDGLRTRSLASWLWSMMFFALAVASQYYCIFMLIPVAVLVLGHGCRSGHWEWRAGLFLIAAGGILAVHYPLITVLREWTKSYWSKPGLMNMFHLETLLVAIALMGLGLAIMHRSKTVMDKASDRLLTGFFLLTLASLPLFVVPLIRVTTNAFVDRYLTFTVIGLVGVLGWMLDALQCRPWLRRGAMTAIFLSVFWQGYGACQPRVWYPRYMDALTFCSTLKVDVICPSTYVVTEIALYRPDFAKFLAYPLDQQAELIGAASDSSFRIMKANGDIGWLRTEVIRDLCAKGKPFAILTDEQLSYERWVGDVVIASGFDLQEVAAFEGAKPSDGRSIKVHYATLRTPRK